MLEIKVAIEKYEEAQIKFDESILQKRFDIAAAIKSVRTKSGYSIQQMADEIGISRSYLADIESMRRSISENVLLKLKQLAQ